jgi:tetratricopeptide (TPR) repeat protein
MCFAPRRTAARLVEGGDDVTADAGWHADPFGRHQYRYWNGQAWTAHVANDGVATTDDVQNLVSPSPAAASSDTADAEIAALQDADERGDAEASVLLGQALRRVGKFDLARAAYTRGETRGHPEAAMSLGNMLSDLGDTAGARAAYERGIAAGSTMAALNLGLMLADRGEVDDALRYLRVARENGDREAHWAIGKLLEGKGDRIGAVESYEAGAEAGDARAAFDLGALLYDLGDNAASKAAFERADALGHDRATQVLEAFAREPDGALARQLVHRLVAECQEAMRLYDACSAQIIKVQKAEHVASRPDQARASRDTFRGLADRYRQEFLANLGDLRAAQNTARGTWNDVLFHSGVEGQGIDKAVGPLHLEGAINTDELSAIMVGGFVVKVDFGSTMDSFLEADARIAAAMQSAANTQARRG